MVLRTALLAFISPLRVCLPAAAAPLNHNSVQRKGSSSLSLTHRCIHDEPEFQAQQAKLLQQTSAAIEVKNDFDSRRQNSVRAKLRIKTSAIDLEDTNQFCTKQGGSAPTFTGQKSVCVEEDILTAEKKEILVDKVLPVSLITLMDAFMVVDPADKITMTPTFSCAFHTVPNDHKLNGVADADYILYIAAGPTATSTLAWAGPCLVGAKGRPMGGRANFGPMHMLWETPDQRQMQIDTAVHELLHALGFTYQLFGSLKSTSTLRGKSVTILKGSKMTQAYRDLADCSNLDGPELEDEGGSGSKLSHWDRRVLADELMTAAGGDQLSAMTLAFFEDIGWYEPNYTSAKKLLFGRAAGCAFHTKKCSDTAAGKERWFCFEQDNSIFAEKTKCTFDNRGIGTCRVSNGTQDLPPYFQYFPNQPQMGGPEFFDSCPVVVSFPNRRCDIPKSPSATENTLGHFFGDGGRCWDTTGLIKDGFVSTSADGARCLLSQCVAGRPAFRVNDTWWKVCPTDGAEICDVGQSYKGCVKCPPNAAEFCPGVPNVQVLQEEPITQAPKQKSSPSIVGWIRIEGNSWPWLLNDSVFSVMLQHELREDIDNWCDIKLEDSLLETITQEAACASAAESLKGADGNAIKCSIVVLIGFVTFRWTPYGLEDRFEEAAATGGADWMPLTRDLYNTTLHELHNGTKEWNIEPGDLPRITESEMSFNRNFCRDPLDPNEDYCLMLLAGFAVGISVCICIVCCCVKCVRRKMQQSSTKANNPLHEPETVHVDDRGYPSNYDRRHHRNDRRDDHRDYPNHHQHRRH